MGGVRVGGSHASYRGAWRVCIAECSGLTYSIGDHSGAHTGRRDFFEGAADEELRGSWPARAGSTRRALSAQLHVGSPAGVRAHEPRASWAAPWRIVPRLVTATIHAHLVALRCSKWLAARPGLTPTPEPAVMWLRLLSIHAHRQPFRNLNCFGPECVIFWSANTPILHAGASLPRARGRLERGHSRGRRVRTALP